MELDVHLQTRQDSGCGGLDRNDCLDSCVGMLDPQEVALLGGVALMEEVFYCVCVGSL